MTTNIDIQSFVNRIARTANSTLAIGGVSCFDNNFVVAESSVLRINPDIYREGKNPVHPKSAKR